MYVYTGKGRSDGRAGGGQANGLSEQTQHGRDNALYCHGRRHLNATTPPSFDPPWFVRLACPARVASPPSPMAARENKVCPFPLSPLSAPLILLSLVQGFLSLPFPLSFSLTAIRQPRRQPPHQLPQVLRPLPEPSNLLHDNRDPLNNHPPSLRYLEEQGKQRAPRLCIPPSQRRYPSIQRHV